MIGPRRLAPSGGVARNAPPFQRGFNTIGRDRTKRFPRRQRMARQKRRGFRAIIGAVRRGRRRRILETCRRKNEIL
jgi:hypothetical protein